MKAGLVADLVVATIIIVNLAICTRMGLIRSLLKYFSSILAFSIAIMTASPIASFCENKFGWGSAVANWNIPFISGQTLLVLIVGVAMFIAVRLVCKIIDGILAHVKDKLKAVNLIDRILGTVFGALVALLELTFAFMLINQMNWTAGLSLTADSGGFLAYRLFDFCRDYMFNIVSAIFSFGASSTPKI